MQYSTKSSTSVGRNEQFYPPWNKFPPPWNKSQGTTQGFYSPKILNIGSESFPGTSSLSSESNDEMESTDPHPSPEPTSSPSSSTSSTRNVKVKVNNKLKFGVDAILESSRDKGAPKQGACHHLILQTNHASDLNCFPMRTVSKDSSSIDEILENRNESLSKLDEQSEIQSISQCPPDSCSPNGKISSMTGQPTTRLFRPSFPYQMPYSSSHIPSFIPLLFAPLSGRQRIGLNVDARLAQYLTQQHAYHIMARSRTFQETAQTMNSHSSTHQLYSGALRQIPTNLSQPSFTNDGSQICGSNYALYPAAVTSSDGSNNLPLTASNLKKKRSWSRAVFSNLQRKGLEKRFEIQKYVTKPDRRQLAAMLGLTDAQVKVWFQNRRMKWRHLEEAASHKRREDRSKADENEIHSDVSSEEIKNEISCEFPDDESQLC